MAETVVIMTTAMDTATKGNTKASRIKGKASRIRDKHITVVGKDIKVSQIKDMALGIRDKHIMVAMVNSITLIKDMDIKVEAVMDTKASQTQVITVVVAMDSSRDCRIKEQLKEVEVKHRSNLKAMDLIKEERINWVVARKGSMIPASKDSRIKDLRALSKPHHSQRLHLVALTALAVVSRTVFLAATRPVFPTIHSRPLDKGIHLVNLEPLNNTVACPAMEDHLFFHHSHLLLHWSIGLKSAP